MHIINDLPYWLMHREAIAAAAQRAGMRVSVASANHEMRDEVLARGYGFHPLPMDRFSLSTDDLRLVFSIRRLLLKERPEIVHLFTIKPLLFGGIALRSLPSGNRPWVIGTVAGLGRGFDLPVAKRQILVSGLKAGLGKVASVLTFENPGDAQTYVDAGIVPASRAEVLNGAGIDLARYHPRLGADANGPVTFLFASRLLRSKGVVAFAEAARRLKSIHGPRVHFRMAGIEALGEPDSVSPDELAAIKNDPAIEWLGAVGATQMPDMMRAADVFVLPTSYPEGLPRSCLEAGACGLAVIAGDVPGTRFLIRPEVDGILLSQPDADAVTAAMERLLDPRERLRLGAALLKKINEGGFSIEAIAGRFLDFYGLKP
jgi:glycosyltransferase involved in cell wall biosynthesis